MPIPAESTAERQADEVRERRIQAARDLIVCDPEILGGTPVIRGTRVPVHTIAAWVADGESMDSILESYPSVTREQVELAAIFVEAFPHEESPRGGLKLPAGATLIYCRTEPLHRRA